MVGAAREQLLAAHALDPSGDSTSGGGGGGGGGGDSSERSQVIVPSPHLARQCPVAAEGLGKKTPRWLNFAQRVVSTAPAARQSGGRKAKGKVGRQRVIADSTRYFAARKI
jgi:hypothetical protein